MRAHENHVQWGAKYFVTFIDNFSRKIWIYLIKAKSECFDKFKEFKAQVEKECKKKIKVFRSNNSDEFMSKESKNLLKKDGIAKQTSSS